jgi:hypothetical protein
MITAGEAAAFLAGSRRLRYRTVQTSGRSCHFGKGQVRIGDRVESMPKFRHRACRCRLRSGTGTSRLRQFVSVAPAGILFMISRAHPGPALWEIRNLTVREVCGSESRRSIGPCDSGHSDHLKSSRTALSELSESERSEQLPRAKKLKENVMPPAKRATAAKMPASAAKVTTRAKKVAPPAKVTAPQRKPLRRRKPPRLPKRPSR